MAEAPTFEQVSTDFPPPNFPTVFADGVLNVAHSPAIAKFYLFRFEPSFKGTNVYQRQPFAQVVMPLDAFIATYLFFDQTVSVLLSQGVITREKVEELRRSSQSGKSDA